MAGPQNKLADLNNHLFAQLERLGDDAELLNGWDCDCEGR